MQMINTIVVEVDN